MCQAMAKVVRVVGNCFFVAHPLQDGSAVRAELEGARPLLHRLTDDELARSALPLLDLLLERLRPCPACHAALAGMLDSLAGARPGAAARSGVRPHEVHAGGHCPTVAGPGRMPCYEEPPARPRLEFHAMTVRGLGWHMVAKVGRLSSSPLALGLIDAPREATLRRLADVLRCGTWGRGHADFAEIKRTLGEGADAGREWAAYGELVRREVGADAVETVEPLPLPDPDEPAAADRVAWHDAEMSGRPYRLARIGAVLGSPAAVLLLREAADASALDRLADVFRLGVRSRCFADFAASLREAGRDDEEARDEWDRLAAAVAWELGGGGAEGEVSADGQSDGGPIA